MVAQQVLSVIGALMQKLKLFIFEGNEIRLTPTIGMFITMNPGYAGRYKRISNRCFYFLQIRLLSVRNFQIILNQCFDQYL